MTYRPTKSSRPWRSLLTGLIWIGPWLVGFCLFMLVPILISGYLSFCQFNGLRAPVFTGFENLRTLAADPLFWKVLKNTAIYAAVALPVGTALALTFAVLLNTSVPGRAFWRALIFMPTLVPLVAIAMIWMWMFNGRYGLINTALGLVGVEGPNWLSDPHWTMASMIILSFWSVGHAVVIYLAGLQDVPRSLYEAAHLDGAGPFRRLRLITLPMISPSIFFNVVVGIIFVWQVFVVPYVMVPGGGPGRNAYFYTMYLYDVAFMHQRFGYACLLSWIQLGIILGLTMLAFRLSRHLVHYQGATR
jgi:multiple sugar transport system permease protein